MLESQPQTHTPVSLEELAEQLAHEHTTTRVDRNTPLRLLSHVNTQESIIEAAYQHFREASKQEVALSYIAEWLLDNHYIIKQAFRQIREDLPPGYYHDLPCLIHSPYEGLPRVYAVAVALVQPLNSEIDLEHVQQFLLAYQQLLPLEMGELWALPIMLRAALLNKLAQAVDPFARSRSASVSEPVPRQTVVPQTATPAQLRAPMQLPDTPTEGALVGAYINSLRRLGAQDWKTFFEQASLVEKLLRAESSGVYTQMDFDTRNAYRSAIEKLSRQTHIDELSVTRHALDLSASTSTSATQAQPAGGYTGHVRTSHVGYYLIDAGRSQLEQRLHYQPAGWERIKRFAQTHATAVYLASIGSLTLLVLLALGFAVIRNGGTLWLILGALLFSSVPVSTAVISLVNWLVTLALPPRRLPRLDLSDGIPEQYRTCIVIPTLLSKREEIDDLTQQLELHYLRNTDAHLCFALLTDLTDAPQKDMPGDAALIEHAANAIRALNQRHCTTSSCLFYLLHRERQWNPAQDCWMGWERKRGKLEEFNRLLRSDQPTSFITQVGDLHVLRQVRYVITLDTDTILQRGDANRLIGTLAHPLNQAVVDEQTQRVTAGYTILQPRTEIKPNTDANAQSGFTRIFARNAGLDPYTHAVSDVYQDLFNQGIYVGKGIYDVDAFMTALHRRVPSNALLSHDLFEGIHARAALVTDIVLLEDYPPHYLAQMSRQHRWIRGDWQLLPWLTPHVPVQDGAHESNPLSIMDRWKIVDNLRRSLLAPCLVALWLSAWLWLPGSPWAWVAVGAATLAIPLFTHSLTLLVTGVQQRLRGTLSALDWRALRDDFLRWILALVFIPYEALISVDAIATTLIRLWITRRHLLEWTTAARTARLFGPLVKAGVIYRQMLTAMLFILALLAMIIVVRPNHILSALPVLVAWLLSPQIAFWISVPRVTPEAPLLPAQQQWLRCVARRTWLYFERFVGPDDHWLPPDHYQESPLGVIAHQTSPTNIGMLLLSTLAAYDLGYVRRQDMVARLQATFENLHQLERYRGHFLNWYDTRTLAPLPPAYVSTVDSGNLAACLLTLRQGCQHIADAPIMRWERWQGLIDVIELIQAVLNSDASVQTSVQKTAQAAALAGALADATDTAQAAYAAQAAFHAQATSTLTQLNQHLERIEQRIVSMREQPTRWGVLLAEILQDHKPTLDQLLMQHIEPDAPEGTSLGMQTLDQLRTWVDRLNFHLTSMQSEWTLWNPWQTAAQPLPATLQQPHYEKSVQQLASLFVPDTPLKVFGAVCAQAQAQLDTLEHQLRADPALTEAPLKDTLAWCGGLAQHVRLAQETANQLLADNQELMAQTESFYSEMDFRFLYNAQRQVFHIGYNVTNSRLDNNYYDLLASEARIASLIAVAKEDVPASHWLHMGRSLTAVGADQVLLSWSGTMFEYLMPSLILRTYPGTLLDVTCHAVIRVQMDYAKKKHLPWGISESGYYAFDSGQNYQYRAFGVPSLGYKRGQGEDTVIAPYASMLAVTYAPHAVLDNLHALQEANMLGQYGFFEAIDYTESRMPLGQTHATVLSYMAHHQAMSLLALDNYLCGQAMVERLHGDLRIESVDLLLQEKMPSNVPLEEPHPADTDIALVKETPVTIAAWNVPADPPWPEVHVLSHGRFSTLLTSAGAGFSQWQGTALTRWNADPTLEDSGAWIYVQEQHAGRWSREHTWSTTLQPTGHIPEQHEVRFHAHQVEYRRTDDGIAIQTDITVVPGSDVEVRRIILTNRTDQVRRLRLTSYSEVVLTAQANDQRHPAFNKLFIVSEYAPQLNALLFWRRPRSADEKPMYLLHTLVMPTTLHATGAYECDREKFVGRGRSLRAPAALERDGAWLTGSTGATLDPIMSLGQEIVLEPHAQKQMAFITLAAATREDALATARRYQAWNVVDYAFEQARAQSELDLRRLTLGTPQLEQVEKVLSALIYPRPSYRPGAELLALNQKGQNGLWAYGISGDYPLVVVHVRQEGAPIFSEMLQAHTYWRERGLTTNIVFINEHDTGYEQSLGNTLYRIIAATGNTVWLNRRDGIFMLRADQVPDEDHILLHTVARVVLDSDKGTLAEQLRLAPTAAPPLPSFVPSMGAAQDTTPADASAPAAASASVDMGTTEISHPADLQYANGYGGFSADGKEYVIVIEPRNPMQSTPRLPPAPWINVIANPQAGFLVSESGAMCTWVENSGENRLTAWNNDPVSDRSTEAIYLRDEETAAVWSPTPLPAPAASAYQVRHGAGYTTFEHHSHDLAQHLRLFVPPDAPLKLAQLQVQNLTDRPRRLTVTYYAEWVLGTLPDTMRPYIVPEFDTEHQTLLARNAYNAEFGQQMAFVTASQGLHSLTSDRAEFLGRRGSMQSPAALQRIGLSGVVQAGNDPCAAVQIHVDLGPHETRRVHFAVGQGANRDEAIQLARHYQETSAVDAAWEAVQHQWDAILGAVQVRTPEPSMDLLLNRWLLYQALACRVWGRTALYQSSGAFGFRDQLQDVMALTHARPDLTRAQILNAAQRQFEAGDVLHWWHPPSGRGIRSRCSDDLLWLPYVTAHYIRASGDMSILDEKVTFLKGDALKSNEDERYGQFASSTETYTLYEHCIRAIKKGATAGPHKLPLFSGGDWNDGMNHVGREGRGESVWLAWFLTATLDRFANVCEARQDTAQAAAYRDQARSLRMVIEQQAWDGQWYRRGYYDDGAPLGSAQSRECQIDSIAQSWAVLSAAAPQERAARAMQAVDDLLVRRKDQLVLLFTPPFDKTSRDPGYIRGYVPGIRENGGQYTHAATWAAWAYAALGDGEQALSLFNILNPIHHSDTPQKAARYRVEPYVIAADVYGAAPHTGRGGWTWYTGSASWMYRLGIEAILGLQRNGEHLHIKPHIPADWPGFEITYQHLETPYHIRVVNQPAQPAQGQPQTPHVELDRRTLSDDAIPLTNDGYTHEVVVYL